MDARTNIRRLAAGVVLLATAFVVACDDALSPAVTFDGVGAVEGLVFFDASEDGVFDPADGDFGIASVGVTVLDRGTDNAFGSSSSGSDGRFVIGSLPAGTHDMFIDTLTVPEGVTICQNPLQVTVNVSETRFADVRGRPGCLITIAAAKEANQGDFVIVKGIVTSSPNQIENSFAYIEDGSAGIFLFAPALSGQGIEVGDQIEIGGNTASFSGQFQMTNVVLRRHVVDVDTPVPLLTTTGEIAASGSNSTHDLQNRFVRLEKMELQGAFGSVGNIQNAPIDDGSGGILMRIDDGVADRNTLNDLLSVGTCYNVNGFAANFNGAGQIFPRSLADIEEVSCN